MSDWDSNRKRAHEYRFSPDDRLISPLDRLTSPLKSPDETHYSPDSPDVVGNTFEPPENTPKDGLAPILKKGCASSGDQAMSGEVLPSEDPDSVDV